MSEEEFVFVPAPGARISKSEAQLVGEWMARLSGEHPESKVTPERLVEVARDRNHPLHGLFDWNDKRAAQAHRVATAAQLIRSVHIVHVEHAPPAREVSTRAFPNLDRDGSGYQPLRSVTESPELSKRYTEQAQRELVSWYRRYRNICQATQLEGMFQRFEELFPNETRAFVPPVAAE